jgi:uncharacterized beta-barrel protein YwiB (DUF1934 family)
MSFKDFFRYEYVDADGINRVQVNVDGFEGLLRSQGATKVIQSLMTDKEVRAYIKRGASR